MSRTLKILFILVLILLLAGCKKKRLKVIKIPTGENVYFTDNDIPGNGTTFEYNLETTFTADTPADHFKYGEYQYLTLNANYQYTQQNNSIVTGKAIIDPILNLTYVFKEAKMESGGEKSRGSGVFVVITNEAPIPTHPETLTIVQDPAPIPVETYVGISIKSDGRSLYITDTTNNIDNINWKHEIIIDSRERSLEDMWLKNAQDNRVAELTMENSGRVIKDNYLMVYIFTNAITPSRSIYYGFNTTYFIGVELTRAGKMIHLSYDSDDILNGNLSTSPEEIYWTNMSFVGYTTRVEGPITNMPASLIRQYDVYEPLYD